MKIEFIGAAHEVTGSCHYLEVGDLHLLVDCGMEQGADMYVNQDIPVNASELDYIFVTHAHVDHSGLIPLMYKRGFRGNIYATNATTQLCNIMLKDSAHIQESEAEWKNRKAQRSGASEVVPVYDLADAVNVMEQFVPCPYDEEIEICDNIRVTFRDAGHLLGSSFIEMTLKEGEDVRKIVFSGDLGNGNRALIKDPEYANSADYLLIESTYGNRNHDVPIDFATALAEILDKTFSRGGNVIIPAFSVGRTQEILYYIRRIKQEGLVHLHKGFEVYVDSPLSVEATNIFSKNVAECFREEDKKLINEGYNPIQFPGLMTSVTSNDSVAINNINKPIVIISASGMCEAGRIRHHLKHNLWRPECTVIFVGYQVPGTLGYNLLNGAKEVRLFGEPVAVRADIVNLPGISGHADHDHLIQWALKMENKPAQIFVVHGEDKVTEEFAQELSEKMQTKAYAPYSGDVFDLISGRQIAKGDMTLAEKKAKKNKHISDVYEKLLATGERLITVIKKNKGGANKDLAKFADQIDALINKWDK